MAAGMVFMWICQRETGAEPAPPRSSRPLDAVNGTHTLGHRSLQDPLRAFCTKSQLAKEGRVSTSLRVRKRFRLPQTPSWPSRAGARFTLSSS